MVEEEKSPLSVSLVTFGFDLIVPLVFSNRHEVSARKKHVQKNMRGRGLGTYEKVGLKRTSLATLIFIKQRDMVVRTEHQIAGGRH